MDKVKAKTVMERLPACQFPCGKVVKPVRRG